MTKSIKKLAALFIIAVMSVSFIPILGFQDVYAAEGGTPLSGDVLNGCKVRIRPAGSHQPLSIYHDGSDSHDHVHLFVQGKSSQFYLEKRMTTVILSISILITGMINQRHRVTAVWT